MSNEQKVKQEYPRCKCIRHGGIYMVLAWDAFLAVGPLLGEGSTNEEAWKRAAMNL